MTRLKFTTMSATRATKVRGRTSGQSSTLTPNQWKIHEATKTLTVTLLLLYRSRSGLISPRNSRRSRFPTKLREPATYGGKTRADASKTGNDIISSTDPQIGTGKRSATTTTTSQGSNWLKLASKLPQLAATCQTSPATTTNETHASNARKRFGSGRLRGRRTPVSPEADVADM